MLRMIMAGMRPILLLGTLAAGALGCAATREITYDTTAVQRAHQSALPIALHVTTFEDARRSHGPSALLFAGERETELDGRDVCVNAEKHYAKGEVAAQVTALAAQHLQQRGLFRAPVTVGALARADYVLTGSLRALYAVQETSSSAQVGAAFGLIGALASSGATTDGHVQIVLGGLRLRNGDGRELARLPNVVIDFEGELGADAYCWMIYEHANQKLREALDRLASDLERRVLALRRADR